MDSYVLKGRSCVTINTKKREMLHDPQNKILLCTKGAVGIQYSYGLHFLNFGAFFIDRIVSQSHYLF